MRTDRLLGILMILAHTPKITAQELADRFEVSKRTIFRDLQVLSQAGAADHRPIQAQAAVWRCWKAIRLMSRCLRIRIE